MRQFTPRGAATAGLSPLLLRRAVESGTDEPALAAGPDPLSAGTAPWLVSVPVLGALAALALAFVGAVASWLLYRRGGASEREPRAPSPAPATADQSPSPSTVDTPTLSDDEAFVVDLLRRHDGRLRQSAIVEASEWSKSKVSRLLSSMERKEYVEKVAVGRENAIVLSFGVE